MSSNPKPCYILGISCFYHDAAAVLIKDGKLLSAAQEERFTRKKHNEDFPEEAINYCLRQAGISVGDLAYVGFYEKSFLKFERILVDFIESWPRDYKFFLKVMPQWLKQKLWPKTIIRKKLNFSGPIFFAEHHMSHAASSFFTSPFEEAAIITVDGVGEFATTTYGYGTYNKIELREEIDYPDSLGLFYSLLTYYLGFKPNSAEYKVMGLAPYGKAVYKKTLHDFININEDGSFAVNRKKIPSYHDTSVFEKKLEKAIGFPRRKPDEPLEQCHKDLSASLQELVNEAMVKLAVYARNRTNSNNLCLAGGVALNCVANSNILREAGFKNVFIQPASGDAGGALGAAFFIWNQILDNPRNFVMEHCFWGPNFTNTEIENIIKEKGVNYEILDDDLLVNKVASLIGDQKIIGWFQGRMEWGPRALGNRSILADPRNKENWQRVNLKIKFRESFRPFAPSVLEESANSYFKLTGRSPFMLLTSDVIVTDIPAVTHIDGTARLQTVDMKSNPLYHSLISEFGNLTGCPILINTSFNVRGEPIVCTPEDAFNTFIKTEIDYLVLGNLILDKKEVKKKYPFQKPIILSDAD